jgi:hypothetical protein
MPDSFQVKLKVLSPIHIGSGEKLNKLDYYLDSGSFCRVDMDGLFQDPGFADVRARFLKAAPGGQPIDSILGRDGLHRQHVLYRIPIHISARNRHETEVSTFIKSAGRVYIPGSSVKGAILSALCWHVLKEKGPESAKRVLLGYDAPDRQGRNRHFFDDPLEVTLKSVGGRAANTLGKFTHWLDVSDSDFKAPGDCLELTFAESRREQPRTPYPGARLQHGGAIPILLEAVKPGVEFTFVLKQDRDFSMTAAELLQVVNEFYQQVAKNDKLVLPDVGLRLPQTGLLRVGSACGFFATSLLLTARKHGLEERYLQSLSTPRRRVTAPRSRKRIGQLAIGWAQVEMVS